MFAEAAKKQQEQQQNPPKITSSILSIHTHQPSTAGVNSCQSCVQLIPKDIRQKDRKKLGGVAEHNSSQRLIERGGQTGISHLHRTDWLQWRIEGERGGSDLVALSIESVDSDGTSGGHGGRCLAGTEDTTKGEETGAESLVLRGMRRERWLASRPCGTDTAVWRFGL